MTDQAAAKRFDVTGEGPHPGWLAILYCLLFNAGLAPVTALGGLPYWAGPWESPATIVSYFQTHRGPVLTCVFLQFGATVCLGMFTATLVSRLRNFGVSLAACTAALFGGFLVVADGIGAGLAAWAMIHPSVVPNGAVLLSLYYFSCALGGPGFSVPMGLLMASVCFGAARRRLLPKWILALGFVLAASGVLSWLNLISASALFLIPLTRFPGFIWLIATPFALRERARVPS